MTRIGIVGGGIVGLAVARRLALTRPGARVTVLEKEDRVGAHQTGHNSGVAHAGLYYPTGSLKARLCRRGVTLLSQYCDARGLPFVACGKLVVARDAAEAGRLDEIERRARANGVPGLRRLDAVGLREIEPHARGVTALHSPSTAIVDFAAVARSFADDVRTAGGEIRLNFPVAWIRSAGSSSRPSSARPAPAQPCSAEPSSAELSRDRRPDGSVVVGAAHGEELEFELLVVCAGLQSDRVSRLAGDGPGPAIVPFRGEYYRLRPEKTDLVRGLIYPVPDPRYPFLGIHLTRRIDGTVEIGPNAVLALAREGYGWRAVVAADAWETLRWPGFRRLARNHWRTAIRELHGSLSRHAFAAAARSYVPELSPGDVERAGAGVRAQAVDADGTLVDDFRINRLGPVVTVRNAPSPGATSALAIADHIVNTYLPPAD